VAVAYAGGMKRKQGRRSAADWSELVEAWARSGESAAAFAARVGVKPAALHWWRWRLRRSPSRGPRVTEVARGEVELVPLVVADEADPSASGWSLETRDGLRIHMNGPDAAHGLEVALRVLVGRGRS